MHETVSGMLIGAGVTAVAFAVYRAVSAAKPPTPRSDVRDDYYPGVVESDGPSLSTTLRSDLPLVPSTTALPATPRSAALPTTARTPAKPATPQTTAVPVTATSSPSELDPLHPLHPLSVLNPLSPFHGFFHGEGRQAFAAPGDDDWRPVGEADGSSGGDCEWPADGVPIANGDWHS